MLVTRAVRTIRFWIGIVARVAGALLCASAIIGAWGEIADMAISLANLSDFNSSYVLKKILMWHAPKLALGLALFLGYRRIPRILIPAAEAGCPECGYTLTDLPAWAAGRCPECGTVVEGAPTGAGPADR